MKGLSTFEKKTFANALGYQGLGKHRFRHHPLLLVQRAKTEQNLGRSSGRVKNTFERLGIHEQERKFLAGVEAQFDSEAAYSRMKDDLEEKGVIFVGSTDGLRIIRKFSRNGSARSFPPPTTSFPLSTARSSAGEASFISRRASNSSNRFKPISVSMRKTSVSSNAR